MEMYYLTNEGSILNARLRCFQTIEGDFLRSVYFKEFKPLTEILSPCYFPKGIKEAQLSIWELLWLANTERDVAICFTREVNKHKREYCVLYDSSICTNHNYVEIIDIDALFSVYVEREKDSYDLAIRLLESSHCEEASLQEVFELGKPSKKEKIERIKILESIGIDMKIK